MLSVESAEFESIHENRNLRRYRFHDKSRKWQPDERRSKLSRNHKENKQSSLFSDLKKPKIEHPKTVVINKFTTPTDHASLNKSNLNNDTTEYDDVEDVSNESEEFSNESKENVQYDEKGTSKFDTSLEKNSSDNNSHVITEMIRIGETNFTEFENTMESSNPEFYSKMNTTEIIANGKHVNNRSNKTLENESTKTLQ
ncbi:hypothetical protein GJ496_008417 [Pomphorhynchus laevis]|nr:hypothetical protein GJ496_000516 [Pomphorhynchus laevis]KAI0977679.1 hypothetical protein GJ496_000520 [Pomphorhynchus laevis]KAI0987277.1 hypothetical protein GJ496_002024 [Pomphorhynchus laevis]KAI0987283.1 hypothetical protein GJ496_002029 [Pomphorhynchus laevis]KAI0987598.1 hypothetical protein GJ496_008412 [Pomphorhynchus laevis]